MNGEHTGQAKYPNLTHLKRIMLKRIIAFGGVIVFQLEISTIDRRWMFLVSQGLRQKRDQIYISLLTGC